MSGVQAPKERQSVGRLIAIFVGFVAVGIPIVGYIWGVLSDILAGDVRGWSIAIALVALLVLLVLLRWLANKVQQIDGRGTPPSHPPFT